MYNADSAFPAARHYNFRQVYGVDDIAVFNVIYKLLSSHSRAVILRFGGRSAEVRYCNNALRAQNIVGREIGNIGSNLARFERCQKVFAVYKSAAREIENTYAVLHFSNSRSVYKVFGGIGQRHMHGNIIALFKNFVYIENMDRIVGQIPSRFNRKVRVIAENLHTEGVCGICHHNADSAEAYNTQGLALNFRTGKSALALFYLFAYLCAVALKGLSPLNAGNHAA